MGLDLVNSITYKKNRPWIESGFLINDGCLQLGNDNATYKLTV